MATSAVPCTWSTTALPVAPFAVPSAAYIPGREHPIKVTDEGECAALCEADSQCVAYTLQADSHCTLVASISGFGSAALRGFKSGLCTRGVRGTCCFSDHVNGSSACTITGCNDGSSVTPTSSICHYADWTCAGCARARAARMHYCLPQHGPAALPVAVPNSMMLPFSKGSTWGSRNPQQPTTWAEWMSRVPTVHRTPTPRNKAAGEDVRCTLNLTISRPSSLGFRVHVGEWDVGRVLVWHLAMPVSVSRVWGRVTKHGNKTGDERALAFELRGTKATTGQDDSFGFSLHSPYTGGSVVTCDDRAARSPHASPPFQVEQAGMHAKEHRESGGGGLGQHGTDAADPIQWKTNVDGAHAYRPPPDEVTNKWAALLRTIKDPSVT